MDSSLLTGEVQALRKAVLNTRSFQASLVTGREASRPSMARGNWVCLRASRSRTIAGCAGPLLLGLGSGISISAGFGSFGFSVLLDGINQSMSQPLWLSQIVITLLLYLIAWCWAGIPLGVGSVPALLLIGPAISFGAMITPENVSFAGDVLAFVTGLIFFALGICLSAAAALGPDGVTALSLAAEKRKLLPVSRATFLWNFIAIVSGSALGGYCGIATFAGLLCVPVIIHYLLPWLRAHVVK